MFSKLGVRYQVTLALHVSGGVSLNSAAYADEDTASNVTSPATFRRHYTLGLGYATGPNSKWSVFYSLVSRLHHYRQLGTGFGRCHPTFRQSHGSRPGNPVDAATEHRRAVLAALLIAIDTLIIHHGVRFDDGLSYSACQR
ncbi:hypothetical protein ACU4HD_32075 [Cupriavidus basilensis]